MVLRRGAVFKYPLSRQWCCFSRKYSVAPLGSQSVWPGSGVRVGKRALDYHTHNNNTERGPPCFGLRVGILIVCQYSSQQHHSIPHHHSRLRRVVMVSIVIVHHRILPTTKEEDNGKSTATQFLPSLDGLQCTRGRKCYDKDAASLLTASKASAL